MAFLEVKNLDFSYNGSSNKQLDNLSFCVEKGEFVVVVGESGSGKSTLLKLMKKELAPYGKKSGEIFVDEKEISKFGTKESCQKIGFLFQDVESQIVSDKVYSELAFLLESLGMKNSAIQNRIAETSEFFGISTWFQKKTSELSGGQKQTLNLASLLVAEPKLLLLDEPTTSLDPIAREQFLQTLKKVNKELGITIVVVEHNLENLFEYADKILVLSDGKIEKFGTPQEIANDSKNILNRNLVLSLPSVVRIFAEIENSQKFGDCPLKFLDAKEWLKSNFSNEKKCLNEDSKNLENKEYNAKYNEKKIDQNNDKKKQYENLKPQVALEISNGCFRYEKMQQDILHGLNLKIFDNEIFSIIGGNGAGKSTLLKVLCNIKKLYAGKFSIFGKAQNILSKKKNFENKIVLLPQNPKTLFLQETVQEEFEDMAKLQKIENAKERTFELVHAFRLEKLLESHPYDLSGGEAQKVAIAKALLGCPKILLLDEPTQSLDGQAKEVLKQILCDLKNSGITIVLVTHDLEFSAEVSDRCGMLFDGKILNAENTNLFFSSNSFYTTYSAKLSKGIYERVTTVKDLTKLVNENGEKNAKNHEYKHK